MKVERQVGKTGEYPSIHGCRKSPPQAVENRKISAVPKRPKIDHFSAGSGVAEKGNRLVLGRDVRVGRRHGDCTKSI